MDAKDPRDSIAFSSFPSNTKSSIFAYKHPDLSSVLEYTRHFTQDGRSMSSWGPNYDGFKAMYGFAHMGAGAGVTSGKGNL